jgi:hypothetical protein
VCSNNLAHLGKAARGTLRSSKPFTLLYGTRMGADKYQTLFNSWHKKINFTCKKTYSIDLIELHIEMVLDPFI